MLLLSMCSSVVRLCRSFMASLSSASLRSNSRRNASSILRGETKRTHKCFIVSFPTFIFSTNVPDPLIYHKQCFNSALMHIRTSGQCMYLPSAFAVLNPASLRPVHFGNTFNISIAKDREYHCNILSAYTVLYNICIEL